MLAVYGRTIDLWLIRGLAASPKPRGSSVGRSHVSLLRMVPATYASLAQPYAVRLGVWDVVVSELPAARTRITALLDELEKKNPSEK